MRGRNRCGARQVELLPDGGVTVFNRGRSGLHGFCWAGSLEPCGCACKEI